MKSDSAPDSRMAAMLAWISGIEAVAGARPMPASSDASFRRYFRLQKGGKSFIAMDAPPADEDSQPFVRVAAYLESLSLNAPRVIEADMGQGFLLLTDLGKEQYLDVLKSEPELSEAMYANAIAALVRLQQRGAKYQSRLPPYDETLLRFELSLFRDWLCGTHMGIQFSNDDEAKWRACCDVLTRNALDQSRVFVHRDFHSRNLMRTQHDNPGILDFQDAVEGPLTYDIVSLLKDCYIRWPAADVRRWALDFYARLDRQVRTDVNEMQFRRYFELMGIQRHLKAAGIFCRLNHRDGKPSYLADVPRTLEYINELAGDYEELDFLFRLLCEKVLPCWGDTR